MNILFTVLFVAEMVTAGFSQKTNEQRIRNLVQDYEKAVDEAAVEEAGTYLHDNFRVVANQLFGAEDVSLMDKTSYLELMKAGKIGGIQRSHEIQSVSIEGHIAVVKLTMKSEELTFETFLSLVQSKSGAWKIIEDLPLISKN